jgi:hypothetical protein
MGLPLTDDSLLIGDTLLLLLFSLPEDDFLGDSRRFVGVRNRQAGLGERGLCAMAGHGRVDSTCEFLAASARCWIDRCSVL